MESEGKSAHALPTLERAIPPGAAAEEVCRESAPVSGWSRGLMWRLVGSGKLHRKSVSMTFPVALTSLIAGFESGDWVRKDEGLKVN
ncbi:unnamed protein product [Leuciscus chuanchicus]